MKIFALIFSLFIIVFSCTDSRAPSGISGTVLYGEGDCTNSDNRIYKPYTGRVWIIEKSVIDTMNIIQFDSTKSNMLLTKAIGGQFSILVPPGTYYVIADTLYYISSENIITLKPDDLLEREFSFFKCI